MNGDDYPVASYKTGSIAPLVAMGPTLEAGVAYAVTGDGKSDAGGDVHANSIVALSPDAKVKDWYTPTDPSSLQNVTPVAFTYNEKKLLVAPGANGSYVLLDATSLGGADHHTALASTSPVSKAKEDAIAALATWQDAGTTWVLASVPGALNDAAKFAGSNGEATHGSIVAFRLEESAGKTTMVPAWVSRDLVNPAPPVIANGLVIALSQGDPSTHATLYVLDATTGKELYSSGDAINTYANRAGVAVGDGHAFFVTHDNTMYSFGIGMEH
jgi:outer membrane protein assembly factor BamB